MLPSGAVLGSDPDRHGHLRLVLIRVIWHSLVMFRARQLMRTLASGSALCGRLDLQRVGTAATSACTEGYVWPAPKSAARTYGGAALGDCAGLQVTVCTGMRQGRTVGYYTTDRANLPVTGMCAVRSRCTCTSTLYTTRRPRQRAPGIERIGTAGRGHDP